MFYIFSRLVNEHNFMIPLSDLDVSKACLAQLLSTLMSTMCARECMATTGETPDDVFVSGEGTDTLIIVVCSSFNLWIFTRLFAWNCCFLPGDTDWSEHLFQFLAE